LASGRVLLTMLFRQNEVIAMNPHIRYNHIILCSKVKSIDKDCEYSQDWATTTIATATSNI
jgi:hypothetical protein